MQKLSLNGEWTLTVSGWDHAVRATVPGSVYHDLLTAGDIPDPFYRDNETAALKLMEHDFAYARDFEVPEGLLACDRVLLRCEGLDTLAEIAVNGVAVVADKLFEGETAIVALVQEDEPAFDAVFSGFKTTIIRYDAADIAAEAEELRELQEQASEEVANQMKAERKAEREAKFAAQIDEYVAATNRTMGDVTPM